MKHGKSLVLILSGLSLAIAAFTAGNVVFQRKAESSFKVSIDNRGRKQYAAVVHDFEHINSLSGPDMLVAVEKNIRYIEGSEGIRGKLTARAFVNGSSSFDHPAWTIEDEAQSYEVSYEPELFVTEQAGCCGGDDTARAYNLRSGNYLFSYNSSVMPATRAKKLAPFSIEVPNASVTRLLGVLSCSSVRDLPEALPRGEQLLALVTYASMKSVIDRVVLTIAGGSNYYPSVLSAELVPSLSASTENELHDGRHLVLWDVDRRGNAGALSNFAVRVKVALDRDVEIVIPIKNDRLDLAGAQWPVGVRALAIP